MTDSRMRAPGWTPDLSTFGARLALVRQHMGWGNVKQAAQLCSLPVESWRTWERDGVTPRNYINVCMKIAGVTGVDLNWLAVGPQSANPAYSEAAVAVTRRYPLGEHVVTVGNMDQERDQGKSRSVTRARPIDNRQRADRSDV